MSCPRKGTGLLLSGAIIHRRYSASVSRLLLLALIFNSFFKVVVSEGIIR